MKFTKPTPIHLTSTVKVSRHGEFVEVQGSQSNLNDGLIKMALIKEGWKIHPDRGDSYSISGGTSIDRGALCYELEEAYGVTSPTSEASQTNDTQLISAIVKEIIKWDDEVRGFTAATFADEWTPFGVNNDHAMSIVPVAKNILKAIRES
jgi:hypothetical protein